MKSPDREIPDRPPWRWFVAGWVFLSVLNTTQLGVDRGEASLGRWLTDAVWAAASWSFWLLAAPLVFALGRRFPPSRGRWSNVLVHLAISFALPLLHAPLFAAATLFFKPFGPLDQTLEELMRAAVSWTLHAEVAIYWAILGAAQAVAHMQRARERERRSAQLEVQLSAARLDALRSQLRPHFLFNALNTVAMLARQERHRDAAETVAALGELLRATLDSDQQMTDLGTEIELVRLYLDIERIRFSDRLKPEIDVADELLSLEVPSLVLQPLVENAIRHGLAHCEGAGVVRVSAARRGDRLELAVTNDGPAPPQDPGDEGIGLGNTRERLRQIFGTAAELTLGREDDRTVARLLLPCSGGTS